MPIGEGDIHSFLRSKSLSDQSQTAYFYDLQQFVSKCEGEISAAALATYQLFLRGLKPAVQKRKISAVNQFLYYLYEKEKVERYHKLKRSPQLERPAKSVVCENMDFLEADSRYLTGQFIAQLMAYLGLLPSELATIRLAAIDIEFRILTIDKAGKKRILTIPEHLLPSFSSKQGVYLFDKHGEPYSRQWFFNRLTEFLKEQGKEDWTAQKLREQFILHQLKDGKSLMEIAKLLGLKTIASLEKYKDGY